MIWNVLTNTAPSDPPTFPEVITSYAAGACINYISPDNFTGWYLPAICELGYGVTVSTMSLCGSQSAPILQNIQTNLFDIDDTSIIASGLLGVHWSSTESSVSPYKGAYLYSLETPPTMSSTIKAASLQVRCVRAFTN